MIQEWQVFPGSSGGGISNGTVYAFDGSSHLESVYNVSWGTEEESYSHLINYTMNSSGFASTDLDIGDINGDGFEDILIGSGFQAFEGEGSGGAQVVFGGRDLPEIIDLDVYPHVNITSQPGYMLGGVAHADINGDGVDDIITSAPAAFSDLSGGAFAFYGDPLLAPGKYDILNNDFQIRGLLEDWDMNVENAGDVNNDGRDDLWIHSNEGQIGDNSGVYYLLYTNQTDSFPDPSKYNLKLEQPFYKVISADSGNNFGLYSRNDLMILDFDGDGSPEILTVDPVGNLPGRPEASGVAYLYYSTITESVPLLFHYNGDRGNRCRHNGS
jgi:hypothetical protein